MTNKAMTEIDKEINFYGVGIAINCFVRYIGSLLKIEQINEQTDKMCAYPICIGFEKLILSESIKLFYLSSKC